MLFFVPQHKMIFLTRINITYDLNIIIDIKVFADKICLALKRNIKKISFFKIIYTIPYLLYIVHDSYIIPYNCKTNKSTMDGSMYDATTNVVLYIYTRYEYTFAYYID